MILTDIFAYNNTSDTYYEQLNYFTIFIQQVCSGVIIIIVLRPIVCSY